MVGQGGLLETAQAEARSLGVGVVFAGFRDDAARIAACCDVYVLPSLYEGLGRALCEALAAGRPAAATAVNGVVDIIEPGVTGLLSPPADPAALAHNVIWLLDHPDEARQMGEAAQRRVRALFEPTLMCRQIEDIYSRLLGLRWPSQEHAPVPGVAGRTPGNAEEPVRPR
jgi:glycosyltransferase involved in cell wall biosynthesis